VRVRHEKVSIVVINSDRSSSEGIEFFITDVWWAFTHLIIVEFSPGEQTKSREKI